MSQKLEATAEIQSSADKFYGFFKNRMSDLVNIFPAGFKSAQVIEGHEGSVGAVLLYNFVAGGITQTVTLRTEAINDEQRTVTYKPLEGDVLKLYPSYQFTIAVSDGSVKWTIEYEKALPVVPPPEIYMVLALGCTKAVDAYLLLSH
ncbi:MLP 34 [Olea europaea subsp. europaea]|uniref:MLP 34 n=1 Tax=Olea europaea subsp. europaea TaxID=158383 RepID=A0A8S0T826_OLEEU|nr:MLP 34 [Olea europaea subsp. europaea]